MGTPPNPRLFCYPVPVTDPLLPLLVCVACLLPALAGAEAMFGARIRQGIGLAAACLSGWGALLTLVWLLVGAEPARLALPIGPPGMALTLALDALSGFFLLLVFAAGAAIIAFATELHAPRRSQALAGPIAGLGTCALALLAADPVTLALSLCATGLIPWLAEPQVRQRAAPCGRLAWVGLTAAGATLLLASPTASLGWTGGAVPAESWRTALVMLLALAGPGALLGLIPPHRGATAMLVAASPATRAILGGCVMPVAAALLLRIALAPHPPEASFWWGVPWLLLGGSAAILTAWRSARAADLPSILTELTQRQGGLLAVGIGLALIARSADLPDMAALALGAVCLLAAGQALSGTVVLLSGWAAGFAAGTIRLDRLGGLLHRMPLTGTAMLIGLVGLLALPPGIGFAALWQLVQAILTAPRAGLVSAWLLALLAGALGVSAALALAAAIRVCGIALLGRPRQPRASAAEEIPRAAHLTLLVLAGVSALIGMLPALVPALLARSAIRGLTEGSERADPGLLMLVAGRSGYAPLVVWALIGVAVVLLARLLRRPDSDARPTPAWSGGFAPPPAWLPYGDPLTQTDGGGFVAETRLASTWTWASKRIGLILPLKARGLSTRTRPRLIAAAPWLIVLAVIPLLIALAERGAP